MARLKFGSFEVKAELPKMLTKEQVAIIEAIPLSVPDAYTKVIGSPALTELPSSPAPKEIDLRPIYDRFTGHDIRLTALENKPEVIIPEVKTVTHIQDVSGSVIKQVERTGLAIEAKYDREVAALLSKNREQHIFNWVIGLGLLTSLLLHLL